MASVSVSSSDSDSSSSSSGDVELSPAKRAKVASVRSPTGSPAPVQRAPHATPAVRRDPAAQLAEPASQRTEGVRGGAELAGDGQDVEAELDIVHGILQAKKQNRVAEMDRLFCHALRTCAENPLAPSRYHYLSVAAAAKLVPQVAGLEASYRMLLSFLSPATAGSGGGGGGLSGKRSPLLALLAACLLQRTLASVPDWPKDLVLAYIEDLFGARLWAEHESARLFVDSLQTAFPPHPDAAQQTGSAAEGAPPVNRYGNVRIRQEVKDAFLRRLQQMLSNPAMRDNTKMFVALLSSGCRWPEGRALAAAQLEGLLNQTSQFRAGTQLLDVLLGSICQLEQGDMNAMASILALRVKAMHASLYSRALERLSCRRGEYLAIALTTFINQDVREKGSKGHLMQCLATCIRAAVNGTQESGPLAEGTVELVLATILQDVISSDETRPRVRDLCKRLVKAVAPQLHVGRLCAALLQPPPALVDQPPLFKETVLGESMSLVCLLQLHAAIAALGSGAHAALPRQPGSSGPPADAQRAALSAAAASSAAAAAQQHPAVAAVTEQAANIAEAAMVWCGQVVQAALPGLPSDRFKSLVTRMLFLEPNHSAYFTPGEAFGDTEATALALLTWHTPVKEDTLTHVILLGLTPTPLIPGDGLLVVEALLKRMAGQALSGGRLPAEPLVHDMHLLHAVTRLCIYLPPEGPLEPEEGVAPPPKLAYEALWWVGMRCCVLLATLGMQTVGRAALEQLPTVRVLMEMLVTHSATYPVLRDDATVAAAEQAEEGEKAADAEAVEALVRHQALCGALWQPPPAQNLMRLEPATAARQPPPNVAMDLFALDSSFRLGQALRSCQDPNLLAQITKRQTLEAAWPWLRKVLATDAGLLERLPPAWFPHLFFKLHSPAVSMPPEIPTRLAALLADCLARAQPSSANALESEHEAEEAAGIISRAAIEFFGQQLAARSPSLRGRAVTCLHHILAQLARTRPDAGSPNAMQADGSAGVPMPSDAMEQPGWLQVLASLPAAPDFLQMLLPHISQAVERESDPATLTMYLEFMHRHAPPSPSPASAAAAAARLLHHRPLLAAHLLGMPSATGQASAAAAVMLAIFSAVFAGDRSTAELAASASSDSLQPDLVSLELLESGQTVLQNVPRVVVSSAMTALVAISAASYASGWLPSASTAQRSAAAMDVDMQEAQPEPAAECCEQYNALVERFFQPDTASQSAHGAQSQPAVQLSLANGHHEAALDVSTALQLVASPDARLATAAVAVLAHQPSRLLQALRDMVASPAALPVLLALLDATPADTLSAVLSDLDGTSSRASTAHSLAAIVAAYRSQGCEAGAPFLSALSRIGPAAATLVKDMEMLEPAEPEEPVEGSEPLGQQPLYTSGQLVAVWRQLLDAGDGAVPPAEYWNIRQGLTCLAGQNLRPNWSWLGVVLRACQVIAADIRTAANPASLSAAFQQRSILVLPLLRSLVQVAASAAAQIGQVPELLGLAEVPAELSTALATLASQIGKVGGAGPAAEVAVARQLVHVLTGYQLLLPVPARSAPDGWREQPGGLYELRPAKHSVADMLASIAGGRSVADCFKQVLLEAPLPDFPAVVSELLAHFLQLPLSQRSGGDNGSSPAIRASGEVSMQAAAATLAIGCVSALQHMASAGVPEMPAAVKMEDDIAPEPASAVQGSQDLREALVCDLLLLLDSDLQVAKHQEVLLATLQSALQPELPQAAAPTRLGVARTQLVHVLHKSDWCTRQAIANAVLALHVCAASAEQPAHASTHISGTGGAAARMVLDFLTALLQHPAAWAGWQTPEPLQATSTVSQLLTFMPASGSALVDLCLLESAAPIVDSQAGAADQVRNSTNSAGESSRPRIPLLVTAARQNATILEAIISRLALHSAATTDHSHVQASVSSAAVGWQPCARQLAAQLYLLFPTSVWDCLSRQPDSSPARLCMDYLRDDALQLCRSQSSALSGLVHSSLLRVCSLDAGQGQAGLGLACELGRHHPALLLPHLAALAGRIQPATAALNTAKPDERSATFGMLMKVLALLDILCPTMASQTAAPCHHAATTRHTQSALQESVGPDLHASIAAEPFPPMILDQAGDLLLGWQPVISVMLNTLRELRVQLRAEAGCKAFVSAFADLLCKCVCWPARSATVAAAAQQGYSLSSPMHDFLLQEHSQDGLFAKLAQAFPGILKLAELQQHVEGLAGWALPWQGQQDTHTLPDEVAPLYEGYLKHMQEEQYEEEPAMAPLNQAVGEGCDSSGKGAALTLLAGQVEGPSNLSSMKNPAPYYLLGEAVMHCLQTRDADLLYMAMQHAPASMQYCTHHKGCIASELLQLGAAGALYQ